MNYRISISGLIALLLFLAPLSGMTYNSVMSAGNSAANTISAVITGSTETCQNSQPFPKIIFSANGGTAPYTFTYKTNDGTIKTIQTQNSKDTVGININTFIADTITFTLISVTDQSGQTNFVSGNATVRIDALPDLSMNSSAETSIVNGETFYKVCSNTNIELTFTNISTTQSTNINYSIDWGDGSPTFEASTWSSVNHLYPIGSWKMTYTVISQSGCVNSKAMNIYVGSNPAVSLGSPGNTDNCANTPLTFPISGTENNPPGTIYTVTFNDGTPPQIFNHPPPANVTHVFTSSSCGVSSYNGTTPYPNSFSASIVASNICGVSAVNVVPIYVSTAPVVNFTTPPGTAVPTNTPICLTNATTGYVNEGANCKVVPKLVWEITPSSGFSLTSGSLGNDFNQDNSNLWTRGTDVICPLFTTPGIYTIQLRVDTKRCGNDKVVKTICVEGPLKSAFNISTNSGCAPLEVIAHNITDVSASCNAITKWSVGYTPGNCGTSPPKWSYTNGTNEASTNPTFSFQTPGIYTLKLAMTNSAGTDTLKKIITVKQPPLVSIQNISDYCGKATIHPYADIQTCTTDSETIMYEWTFLGGTPSKAYTRDPGKITYSNSGNYTISLVVTNSCGAKMAVSNLFTVHSSPVMDSIPNITVNNKELTGTIKFTGSSGIQYAWTNDNTAIGLAASGQGDILPFTALNPGNTTLKAHITVTPYAQSTGCSGVVSEFNIVVNPSGDLDQPSDVYTSNNETTQSVVFTTSRTGGETSYKWVNTNTSIGLAAAGEGNINPFTAINPKNTVDSAQITVTPYFESGGIQSVGLSKTFKIFVLPSAQVNPPDNIELCNGLKIDSIIFSTTNTGGITNYFWSNNLFEIGLAKKGVGNISGFRVQNSDSIPKTATITVIPEYIFRNYSNTGNPVTFNIKVNPGAFITTQPQSSYLCPGGTAHPLTVEYDYGAGSPKYQWYINKTNSNKGGKLIEGATNNTYSPSTDYPGANWYYCEIILPNGVCSDIVSDAAEVSVNNSAVITEQPPVLQNICIGGTVLKPLKATFTGGSGYTDYQWFFSSSATKAGAVAIKGAIDSVFTPPAFDHTGQFYYFIQITHSGDGCGVISSDLSQINVVPDPVIISQPVDSQIICQGTAPIDLAISVNGGLGVYSYQWYKNTVRNNFSGVAIDGAIYNHLTPPTDLTGTMYYYCRVTQPNGPGCDVISNVAMVCINPAAVINKQPVSESACLNDSISPLSVSYLYGNNSAKYQWYSNTVKSTQNGTPVPGAVGSSIIPWSNTAGSIYYYCKISFDNGGFPSILSDVATVNIQPIPYISNKTVIVCTGNNYTINPDIVGGDYIPAGTLFTWSAPEIEPIGSITNIIAEGNAKLAFSQQPTNSTDSIAKAIFSITPLSGTCSGQPFKITLLVAPAIKLNAEVNQVSCYGVNDGSVYTHITGGIPFINSTKYTINWTGPDGFNATGANISNLKPGKYAVTVSDAGGCPVSDTFNIIEPNAINIQTISKKEVDCNGAENGEITVTINGGTLPYNYSWTKNGIFYSSAQNLVNAGSGNYSLVVTDNNGCSSNPVNYTLSEPAPVMVEEINHQDINCYGDNNGAISVKVKGGTPFNNQDDSTSYQYLWSGPGNFTSETNHLFGLKAGHYVLTISDKNGCRQTFDTDIIQPDELVVNTDIHYVTCYGAKDASIQLNISGGTKPYTIEWSNWGSGLLQQHLSPGDYFATVTDAHNCSKTVYANIPEANFAIHPVIHDVSCNGGSNGSIDLNISGGIHPVALKWADDSTAGSTRNNLKAGIYTVTLHDGAPCNINESFIVAEPQPLKISGKITNAYNCESTGSGEIDLTVEGGSPPYSYQWSNGKHSKDIQELAPGTYYVIVTDSAGCSGNGAFVIYRPEPLSINLIKKTDFDCGLNHLKMTSNAIVSGGIPPYNYIWSRGETNTGSGNTMETSQNGSVTLTVTDETGCSVSTSYDINLPVAQIEYSLIDCNRLYYQFSSSDLQVDALNYIYHWDFGDGTSSDGINPEHNYKSPGIYKVRLTISNDICNNVFEKMLYVDQLSGLKLDHEPHYCQGDSTVLHVSGAVYYRWSNGDTGDSIVIKHPGTYSVTGTSIKGCKDTLTFTVSPYDLFQYSIECENDEIIPDGSYVRLWSEDIPYSSYQWDFGDGSTGTGNPVFHGFEANKNGYFDVKLKVVNPNGCIETTTRRFWESTGELPNTFSPNGDGINDYFLKGWNIKIYNRNGLLLYEGTDGWDGRYKGQPVTSDIYFYVLYYPTSIGTSTKTGYVRVIR